MEDGFDVSQFQGFTTVITVSREEWDEMDDSAQRKAYATHHVHVRGPPARQRVRIKAWSRSQIERYIAVDLERQCHGKHSNLSFNSHVLTQSGAHWQMRPSRR